MKAAVVPAFTDPMRIEDRPTPVPGPGQILVRVEASGLCHTGSACGTCEFCVGGWETLCLSQSNTGYSVDGGFAEYVVANAAYVGHVPAGVDPLDAAPLTCAGVTTYKAVKRSGVRQSDLCAVFGIVGLGHLAVQYAVIAGASVAAVDIFDAKLEVHQLDDVNACIDAVLSGEVDARVVFDLR